MAGSLERTGRRIGLVPLFAEVVGIDPDRCTVGLFIGKIRDGSPAEQLGGNQFANTFSDPCLVKIHLQAASVGLLYKLESRIEVRLEERP